MRVMFAMSTASTASTPDRATSRRTTSIAMATPRHSSQEMPQHGSNIRRLRSNPSSETAVPTRTIQAIYDISRDVFEESTPGFMPLPNDVSCLTGFLNGLKLRDLGLRLSMPYFRADTRRRRGVTYVHFKHCPKFSFGVFYLPQSTVIPLHDHPGMTVFSKILHGSMHIKSYDWVRDSPIGNRVTRMPNGDRLAKLHTDAIFDASSETMVLYPESGGNLHCFTAISPCVVLDVMGPPYSEAEGRDCSYFASRVVREGGDGQYAWLKKVDLTLRINFQSMDINIQE